MLAALRLQLVDERLIDIVSGFAAASCPRSGGGVQLGEERLRYAPVIDRAARAELPDVILDAIGRDDDRETDRRLAGPSHVVSRVNRERVVTRGQFRQQAYRLTALQSVTVKHGQPVQTRRHTADPTTRVGLTVIQREDITV